MPRTELNSLPASHTDWSEWRADYGVVVSEFYKTPCALSDRVLLQIQLRRLGFVGVSLDAELEFIVSNKP